MFEITIPVLNEEKLLEVSVIKLYDFILEELPLYQDWAIVIADNGSIDNTAIIGQKLASDNSRIKYIKVGESGVGLALQASWSQSEARIIGYMDLDLATGLKHLNNALLAIESGYDLVYASRLHKKSKVIGRSVLREISSRVFNFILRSYLGVHISDGMCGFKFMKKEIFHKLYSSGAKNKGWFFSTELLVIAEWLHLKIMELPVEWTDSKASHVRVIPLAIQYLKSMKSLKQNKPIYIKA